MQLTKQQIDYIENRLIENGVKYWDIRIELLDHVVSDVESKLQDIDDFDKIVQNSFIGLGWTNWSKFKAVVLERRRELNLKYRKAYNMTFINFFKSFKKVVIFTTFFVFYYFLFDTLSENVFKKTSHLITFFPMVIYFSIVIKNYRKKDKNIKKSAQLESGMFYLMVTFLIFSSILRYVNVEYSLFFIPFYLVLTYAGYKTYQKAKNEVETMYKELQKL